MRATKFSQIARDLERLPSRTTTAIADDISKQIQRDMDSSRDPYGTAWKLKASGKPSILKKSGQGRASIKVLPRSGAGITITVGKKYMIYHQFGGASHLRGPGGSYRLRKLNKLFGTSSDQSGGRNHPPKRQYLPFDTLPRSWGEIVLARYEEALGKTFK